MTAARGRGETDVLNEATGVPRMTLLETKRLTRELGEFQNAKLFVLRDRDLGWGSGLG